MLVAAAVTRDALTDTADAVLDHFVDLAREAGCSWTEIGDALGVSKQAVQQRSAAPASVLRRMLSRLRDPGMVRRLADETRATILAARQCASDLGHHHVGTQHLLLGILAVPDTVAAVTLVAAGATDERVRRAVAGHAPTENTAQARGHFTPRAKKVIELALRESLNDRSDRIGTEHLLRGLLREGKGLGVQALIESGVDLDELRRDLARRLDPEP